MPRSTVTRTLAAVSLSLAFAAASAGAASAAEAPQSGKAAVKPPQVQKLTKQAKRRTRPPANARFAIGPNTAYNLLGLGLGCFGMARQPGGWWYRWCGVSWALPNEASAPKLLEQRHQYWTGSGWAAYVSTWCSPQSGSCVNLAPDIDLAYRFFYE